MFCLNCPFRPCSATVIGATMRSMMVSRLSPLVVKVVPLVRLPAVTLSWVAVMLVTPAYPLSYSTPLICVPPVLEA